MPGPAPKANSVRRGGNVRADTLSTALKVLPRAGRTGEPPAWPMPTKPPKAVADLWRQLWTRPQAVAWEEQGAERVVARYARCLIEAERPKATAAILGEVRQLEDRLGLSPMSMLRLRWSIGDVDDAAGAPAAAEAVVLGMEAYLDRLYAAPAGAGAGLEPGGEESS